MTRHSDFHELDQAAARRTRLDPVYGNCPICRLGATRIIWAAESPWALCAFCAVRWRVNPRVLPAPAWTELSEADFVALCEADDMTGQHFSREQR